MSSKATSLSEPSATRLLWMRLPVPRSNWWKEMSFCSVALNSLTGMLTSPKPMDPLQIARAMPSSYPGSTKDPMADVDELYTLDPAEFVAERDRLAKQLRADGDKEGAAA